MSKQTIDEIIKGYKATTIRLTVQPGDLRTLYNLVNTDLDDSGIIAHILDEIGIDTDLDTDVQSTDVEQPQ